MDKINYSPLTAHLNSMREPDRVEFAKRCNTTIGYIRKRISLGKPFGFAIAKGIFAEGVMMPNQLRPHDWQDYVWNRAKP